MAAALQNIGTNQRRRERGAMISSFVMQWISTYGYWGLAALLMLGIVGIPVPDETLLTFAGYLVYKGRLQLIPTVVSAFAGSCVGISFSYAIGRYPSLWVVRRLGNRIFKVSEERMQRAEAWFMDYGKWLLPFGYFVPGLRHLLAIVAGGTRLDLPVFAIFAFSGALAWSATFVFLGYFLGENWQITIAVLQRHIMLAALLVILLGVALLVWLRGFRRKGQ
jgi:membrane protein DedA with SNARE-associated domain